jgi:hypothetical protein
MFDKNIQSIFGIITITVLLSGCGGSGGGASSTNNSSSPAPQINTSTETSVSSIGVITGFSSVFINGIRYEVENGTEVVY